MATGRDIQVDQLGDRIRAKHGDAVVDEWTGVAGYQCGMTRAHRVVINGRRCYERRCVYCGELAGGRTESRYGNRGDSAEHFRDYPDCWQAHQASWRRGQYRCKCRICGESYWSRVYFGRCCGPCTPEARRRVQREWRQKNRPRPTERPCRRCQRPFTPKRSDAAYCSSACRQAAHRQRTVTETENGRRVPFLINVTSGVTDTETSRRDEISRTITGAA